MPDEKTDAAENKDSAEASATKAPDAAVKEAVKGTEDLTKKVTDYFEARKGGMRDKDTQEHLGPQPEFFDSIAANAVAAVRVDASTGRPADAAAPPAAPTLEDKVAQLREATKKDDLIDTGTDEDAIHKVLENASPDERKALADKYKEKYGVSLEDELRDELSGKDLDRALIALKADRDMAGKLTEVRDGLGDKDQIVKTLENASAEERKKIADQYEKTFGKPLEEDLKEKLSGKDLEEALTALRRPPVPDEVKNAAASPEQLKRVMDAVDADKDGRMSKEEIDKALQDRKVTGADEAVLKEVRKNFDSIAQLTNDQWGSENKITRDDLDRFGHLQTTEKQDTDSRRDVQDFVDKNFTKMDKDKDGFITTKEIDDALADPARTEQEKHALNHMKDHYDSMRKASNDEWGRETSGITRKDVHEWAKEKNEAAESNATRDVDRRAERERLNKALDAHQPPLSEAEKTKFRDNMKDFEERAEKKGFPPDEVAKTYREVSKILESTATQPTSGSDRSKVAMQVMDHAAHPTEINQGQHNTCNVTTVETMTYAKNPSDAAKMVGDIVTTGEYTAKDGTHVKLNPASLRQDSEASSTSPGAGDRDYASQVFQVTAANLMLQKHNPNYEFVQQPSVLSNTNGFGEQIIDKRTGQVVNDSKGKPLSIGADFSTERIAETYNTINGKENFNIGLTTPPYSDKPIHATGVESEKELNEKLLEMKKEGKLPVVVWVHTSAQPFWKDSNSGAAGGAGGAEGGGHVVTITDYHPGPPPKVAIDNQWGPGGDHKWDTPTGPDTSKGITTHDLFIAMHDTKDQKELLKKDVDWNRDQGKIDTGKEVDYHRARYVSGEINSDVYARELNNEMLQANERWKEQKAVNPPTFDQAEHDRAVEKFKQDVSNLPATDRLKALGTLASSDYMPAADSNKLIEGTVNTLLRDKANKIAAGTWTAADQTNYNQYKKDLDRALAKLPPDRQTAIRRQITANAPAGAPTLA